LLRVVRCLPLGTGVRDGDAATPIGVAQASREETAAWPGAIRGGEAALRERKANRPLSAVADAKRTECGCRVGVGKDVQQFTRACEVVLAAGVREQPILAVAVSRSITPNDSPVRLRPGNTPASSAAASCGDAVTKYWP